MLNAYIMLTDLGRDLDCRKLTMEEVFEKTFEVVTLEDAKAGRINFDRWGPPETGASAIGCGVPTTCVVGRGNVLFQRHKAIGHQITDAPTDEWR